MAVLQIQAAPFFASKNRAFWNLQLAGWGAAFLLRAVSALANQQPLDILAMILVTTITGFSISLILSVIYRQLINRRPLVTWGVTALVLPLAGLVTGLTMKETANKPLRGAAPAASDIAEARELLQEHHDNIEQKIEDIDAQIAELEAKREKLAQQHPRIE